MIFFGKLLPYFITPKYFNTACAHVHTYLQNFRGRKLSYKKEPLKLKSAILYTAFRGVGFK